MVPPILLILSLINVLLAAPVVLQEPRQGCVDMADVPEGVILRVSQSEKRSDELEKRWDAYSDEPSWQKRGSSSGSSPAPSVGEPPADQELTANSPPSSQTGTTAIQDAASAPSPEINKLPPLDVDYPLSDEDYHHQARVIRAIMIPTSSENYHASDESGPGPSKAMTTRSGKTDTSGHTGLDRRSQARVIRPGTDGWALVNQELSAFKFDGPGPAGVKRGWARLKHESSAPSRPGPVDEAVCGLESA
jgi:hypothetical protein